MHRFTPARKQEKSGIISHRVVLYYSMRTLAWLISTLTLPLSPKANTCRHIRGQVQVAGTPEHAKVADLQGEYK